MSQGHRKKLTSLYCIFPVYIMSETRGGGFYNQESISQVILNAHLAEVKV